MFPLSDPDIRRTTVPHFTILLIGLNILVFLFELSLGSVGRQVFFYRFGAIPAELAMGADFGRLEMAPGWVVDIATPFSNWVTVLSSIFIHGSFVHILGNMVFLWVFGNTTEDRLGHLRFALLYLGAGVVAVWAQTLVDTGSQVPTIGASGAVAGILGAYFLLFPYSRINTLVVYILITVVRIPAVLLLGVWVLIQFFSGVGSLGTSAAGGVAYWAHLGGFVVGASAIALPRLVRGEPVWPRRRPWPPPDDRWPGPFG